MEQLRTLKNVEVTDTDNLQNQDVGSFHLILEEQETMLLHKDLQELEMVSLHRIGLEEITARLIHQEQGRILKCDLTQEYETVRHVYHKEREIEIIVV